MLKIGVLGTGHLGKIHLKCIGLITNYYELIGFYDPDESTAEQVAETFGVSCFKSAEALIEAADVIDIVTPTTTHYDLAKLAIRAGKQVFIEKPLTHTVAEAKDLVNLSRAYECKVQVGHVERFNPALLAIEDHELAPMFIEGHRLATFNPRGTDVSVVLDLMIHDLDIVLSLVKADVEKVSAGGVSVVSKTPDIANARIEFNNGCVANLTASRLSLKQMRKIRFFQQDAYISLDFLEKQAQVVRLFEPGFPNMPDGESMMEIDTQIGKKLIHMTMPEIEPVNAIKMELETFAESILHKKPPRVSIEDGYKALELAYQITDEIEFRRKRFG